TKVTDIKKPTIADRDAFELALSGRRMNFWTYTTTAHTLRQVLSVDYFKNVVELFGVRSGDRVDVFIGSLTEGIEARLAFDWPQRLAPLTVSLVRKSKLTPCRHDGAALEEAA